MAYRWFTQQYRTTLVPPTSERTNELELTPAGASMLDRLDLVLGEVQTEAFAALTVGQRRTLLHLLQQLS